MNDILKLLFDLYVNQISKIVATIHKECKFTKAEKLALHLLLNSVLSDFIIANTEDESLMQEASDLLFEYTQKETVH